MRTYSISKRFGGSGDRLFSDTEAAKRKRKFDFFGFLVSEEKAAAPESFAGFIKSMKRRDGSYAETDDYEVPRPIEFYSTCWAVCAMKSAGVEVEKETIGYIECRKNGNGSFGSGFDSSEGSIESTYWATLALRLCGKPVPRDSVDYVRSLRKEDGSYGTPGQTCDALTMLKAAGCGLSAEEKSETMKHIVSAFWESEFEDITDCYSAVVSLNLLDAEPGPVMKAEIAERMEGAKADSENEKFKISVIKRCIGKYHAGTQSPPGATPESMSEMCWASWALKLEAYGL